MWRLRLFCYHGISQEQSHNFESQLAALRATGLTFTRLSDALDQKPEGNFAAASFDDGDRSVSEIAQPILDALGIKAIHYITTDFIEQGKLYGGGRNIPAASWDQLGRWIERGHEIGSHTHTHIRMSASSNESQADELNRSREIIRKRLGIEPIHFAYPWGAHNRRTREVIASAAHWKSAATIDRGWNKPTTDLLELHREAVEPDWPMRRIKFRLAVSSIGPLYRMQRAIRIRHQYGDYE